MNAQALWSKLVALPALWRVVLTLFVVVTSVELVLSRFFPRSRAYSGWKHGVEAVGTVWTAVILSVVYLISVGPVSLVMRALGRDLLDTRPAAAATYWKRHEPNPLGADAAARHQF